MYTEGVRLIISLAIYLQA